MNPDAVYLEEYLTLYRGNSDDYDFTVHLTRFSGLLQKRGLVAGPREIADALEAFSVTDFNNKPKCYWVLRTLFVSKPDQIIFFDFAFERFWSFQKITDETASSGETMLFKGAKHFRKRTNPSFLVDNQQTSENVLFKPDYHGANKNNVAGYRNIEYFGLEKTSEMTKLAAEVLEALKGKKGRRKVANEAGKWLDFRKLVRNKLGVGGEPLYLSYYDRKIRPPRLAILLDVSGSMNKYTKALLRLCHECVAKTNQIDVYVFSMTLTDITSELRSKNYTDGLVKIGRKVDGWSGGTDIGNSVAKFRSDRQTKLSKNTTFILMSDGWDTGTPDKLHYELSRIKQSVKSIVWLNPLIGSENFSPDSASMKQSLPLLDVFASARDFESLKKIPSYIN